jgi:hypothetical protein
MTKAQERAIEKMKRSMENSLTKSEEVKEWTITEHEQFVSVVAVTGVKNDEGTYAFYVRNRAQFFIGKRGGITYPVNRIRYKNGNRRKYSTKPLGKFEGFLHIVCEQDRV